MFKIFTHRAFRFLAMFLAINLVAQILYPLRSYALTSGPSQPEMQSFEPAGTTEMVDLFSGDFTYNIPLFELPGPNGGYPFNLHYNSGITMDQEASWVGLGWNLSPGVINRQMRGFPDDFSGDPVVREMDMLPNETFGGTIGGSLEIFGADISKGVGLSVSLGIGVYYNTYKGVGYSLDPGINFHTMSKGSLDAGLGLNLSLDSQEGVGVSPSLSLVSHGNFNNTSYTLGGSYNSRRGLTGVSMGVSATGNNKTRIVKGDRMAAKGTALSGHSVLSFASHAYSPQVSMPMQGRNISLSFRLGGELFGLFGNGYVNGYYNTQYLKDKTSTSGAFGYLYLQNASTADLMDFNREKDGMVRANIPNLASPSLTHDVYSVTGQGIGGMYRPFRNDIGILYDQQMSSTTFGGTGGFETGIGTGAHIGGDLSVNYSNTTSGRWTDQNQLTTVYGFMGQGNNSLFEPWYFKTYGEHTSDSLKEMTFIGDSLPVRFSITSMGNSVDPQYTAMSSLERKDGAMVNSIKNNNFSMETREPRNLGIHPITNKDLLDNNNQEILREYKVKYFIYPSSRDYRNSQDTTTATYSRATHKDYHTSGITAVNPDGSRYVYALPAYNTKQVECQFSVAPPAINCANTANVATLPINKNGTKPNYKINGTDQYFNRTTLPEYAHSYMLTSILGADYIDADSIIGPSVGDLGYWVKFNYVKANAQYKWKVPFQGANYMKGYTNNTSVIDDKGAYIYGEKEVWYLASVETKSHIATFNISQRQDALGVSNEMQNAGDALGAYSYKLDRISLFARGEYERTSGTPVAIRNVYFDYTYDLCGGLPNNSGISVLNSSNVNINAKRGKLTLKKVWFTDQNNTRGSLSPYVFNYNESNPLENPNYNTHKYDRWGNYKPYSSVCDSISQSMEFPYVNQFDPANPNFKSNLDRNMAVWNLKSVTLPSGGTITVNYEADDYAYVQNKQAMQMFNIVSLDSGVVTNTINHPFDPNGTTYNKKRRIYFQLENPLPGSLSVSGRKNLIQQNYIDDSRKVYFKVYMNLKESSKNAFESISGYANISAWDVDVTSIDGSGNYTKAYVELQRMNIGGKTMGYHPFSIAGWQHLRTNQPDLMAVAGYKNSGGSKKAKINGLMNIVGELGRVFKGFYKYAYSNNWSSNIDLTRSYIRLKSPDKIKYGGGIRVKEIVINDNWSSVSGDQNIGGIYGQTYDYSTTEGGMVISSGVASYEPLIGGEEIALRNAKEFSESIPLQTANNLYFEYPVNESYYPSPVVGYRKVTVKSLATKYAPLLGGKDPYNIPSTARTTGQTINEFYTAKDFPVITNETEILSKPFDLFVPVPLLGQITVNNVTSSQGYSIELNDMHGKLKKVSKYAQDANGNIVQSPISWVQYNYQSTPVFSGTGDRSADYYVLNNQVKTLISDKNGVASKSVRYIGQDFDFFTDMRESRTFSSVGGGNLNTDVILLGIFPVPIVMVWPNVSTSTTQVRTAVTNKIIHKSGILVSTEAYDDGSQIRTDNILFDALTGQAVLTSVTNEFEDPVYNYNMPAHLVYDGIGPSYKNIGLRFLANITASSTPNIYNLDTTSNPAKTIPWQNLVPGDEFIINNVSNNQGRKGTYTGSSGKILNFYIEGTSYATGQKEFILIRSGRRNNLSETGQNISALADPTVNRISLSCTKTIKIPKVTVLSKPVYYVDTCTNGEILRINKYIKSATFPNPVNITTSPYNGTRCFNDNLIYLRYASTGTFNYQDGTVLPYSYYRYLYYDPSGNLIDFTQVDSLKNQQYSLSSPVGATGFINVSVDVKYKNGTRTTAYIYADGDRWPIRSYNQNRDSLYAVDTTINVTVYNINKVLSASSDRLSDNWGLDNSNLRGSYWSSANRNNFSNRNSYVKGSEGIWRDYESYHYVDYRTQSSTVNPRTDGSFDNFPLFNFNNPALNCNPNWRRVNTSTNYNIYSAESESKDIESIYSSALYGGKGGDLVSAIAENARNTEIAFESFEDYTANSPINLTNYGTGNLFFQTQAPTGTVDVYNTYSIISANNNSLILEKPFNANYKVISAEVDGIVYLPSAMAGTKIKGTYNVTVDQIYPGNSNYSFIELDKTNFNYGSIKWTGKAKFKMKSSQTVPAFSAPSSVSVSAFGHTGNNSFNVLGTLTSEQKRLNLVPGKKYFYSSWVSRGTNISAPSWGIQPNCQCAGIQTQVIFKDTSGNTISSATLYPSGNIINNWQKLEGEFTVPSKTGSVHISLISGDMGAGSLAAYFDDIRITPSASSMKTYVYNLIDYKLKAILDDNNYATLYFYNSKGQLYLIKKETERGIQTLQESVTHMKEN